MAIVISDISLDGEGDWEVRTDDEPNWRHIYVPFWLFPTREELIAHLRALDGVTVEAPEPRFYAEGHRVWDREAVAAPGSTGEQGGDEWNFVATFWKAGTDDADRQAAAEYAEWLNSKADQ